MSDSNVISLSEIREGLGENAFISDVHSLATELFVIADKAGDKESRNLAAQLIGIASFELMKMERGR